MAFEIIHYMKRKTKGKQGEVALKIDISKVYYHVDWGYLEKIMLKLGFDPKWVSLIMLCVSTVSYRVVVNDVLMGPLEVWVKVILFNLIYSFSLDKLKQLEVSCTEVKFVGAHQFSLKQLHRPFLLLHEYFLAAYISCRWVTMHVKLFLVGFE